VSHLQQVLPVAPEAVWNALPAGVAAIEARNPFYNPQQGLCSCDTGWHLLWGWGHKITARVTAVPGGTQLGIEVTMKNPALDYGHGKRLGRRFAAAVGDPGRAVTASGRSCRYRGWRGRSQRTEGVLRLTPGLSAAPGRYGRQPSSSTPPGMGAAGS
jgi:hypothetical protein